jgi:hypothetical protein
MVLTLTEVLLLTRHDFVILFTQNKFRTLRNTLRLSTLILYFISCNNLPIGSLSLLKEFRIIIVFSGLIK